MSLIHLLIILYVWVIIIASFLSWIPADHDSPVRSVQRVLGRLVDPVLRPLRRIVPSPRVGNAALDLTPIVAIIILLVINALI